MCVYEYPRSVDGRFIKVDKGLAFGEGALACKK